MGSYYPLCRVRLVLRFEEFGGDLSAPIPDKPITLRKGQKDTGEVLEYSKDPDAPAGVTRYLLKAKGGTKTQEASSDNLTHVVDSIVPNTATFTRNSIVSPDQLELEVPFLDFPFDPRLLRSVAVEFFQGTVQVDVWQAAMSAGETVVLPEGRQYRGKIVSNLAFQGWVDTVHVRWAEDVGTVALSCRDSTQLLSDNKAPPQLKLDPKVPIDEAVAKYLASFPQFDGLAVEYRPAGQTIPSLKDSLQKGMDQVGMGPTKGADKMSVWDYLTDMVGITGHIVQMDGQTVVIRRARTLYANGFKREDDPYVGGTVNNINTTVRTLIYGHNLEEFEVDRKYNDAAPTNLEVRCYLPSRKKTLAVRFPGIKGAKAGDKADNKMLVWRVDGISSKEALLIIAQSLYEQISRQELEVSFKTYELASYGGDNDTPDLLWLQSGDPVQVLFARDADGGPVPASAEQMEDTLLDPTRGQEFLLALGYDAKLAAAYAKAYSDSGYQSVYRINEVSYDWSEEGVTIAVKAINYVEVRNDKPLPEGVEQKPGA